MRRLLLFLLFAACLPLSAAAQPASSGQAVPTQQRPIPYPVDPGMLFEAAVQSDTRTTDGTPGPNYWTNTAQYDIDAVLEPDTRMLRGSATIRYHNNSPDTLRRVLMHLRQNVYKEGVIRNRSVDVTGGMPLDTVIVGENGLNEIASRRELMQYGGGYGLQDTRMVVFLPQPLVPDDSVEVIVQWHFEVPGPDNFRMGTDDEVFYLGYWYPQVAVYDDLQGWTAQPYQGNGEFYMGYADYDVRLTVPEGWLVGATGTLQNPTEVLSETVQDRLEQAADTKDIVNIVTADERGAGSATATAGDPSGTLTWHFRAENVRDVAFGTSDQYIWDATRADTGEGTSMIHSFYRPGTSAWERSAEYAQFSIEHLSDMLLPYPYPHMTSVEGIIGGGMEYPMITLIGGDRTPESLFGVTYHEISHMWLPMIVGTNEKAYAWMDEGTTTFNTTEGEADFYDSNAWDPTNQYYYRFAGTPVDAPSMRHSDQYPTDSPARVYASYGKPGVMLHALRGVLGDDAFFAAYRTFVERWAYKHPTPYDFFNTFEDVTGQNLDWFWTGAFYEAWAMDHAIQEVNVSDRQTTVTVADLGDLVMPVMLEVTYDDGTSETVQTSVAPWMDGQRQTTITLDRPASRIEIDAQKYLPDVDRSNNVWTAE